MGGFISAPTNLASPSAIGSTTPNTGRFTTLTLAPSANTTPFTASGYSLTGTNAQSLFDLSGTWNTTGTPTAFKLNVTDTASNASSLLMDLQVGGSSRCSIAKSGRITTIEQFARSNGVFGIATDGSSFEIAAFGSSRAFIRSTGFFESRLSTGGLRWNFGAGAVLVLAYDADNVLAQQNSTNAQTFRLYRTFTDASNYERLGFIATRTTRFAIAAENAGTGAARSLEISFYTSASDPTSTDITSGCFSVWKNSGTGIVKLWVNDGGTMKSVALA